MGDAETRRFHRLDDGRRRRRAGGHRLHPAGQRTFLAFRRVGQHVEHNGRAAEMGHPVLGDCPVDRPRLDPPETDMGAGQRGDRPRKAPAVAVEHRQGPEIDRMRRNRLRHLVAERVQIGAAMMVDDALGVAGRARGVVEGDRVPLVVRGFRGEFRVAGRDEVLVLNVADQLRRRWPQGRRCRPRRVAFPGGPAPRRRPAKTRGRSAEPSLRRGRE